MVTINPIRLTTCWKSLSIVGVVTTSVLFIQADKTILSLRHGSNDRLWKIINVYIWNDLLKEGRQCQQTTLSASRWQPLFPLLDIVFTTTIDVPRDKGEASRVQGQDVWVREARNRGSLLPMWVGQPCAMPMDRQTRWGDGISLASDCCFCYLLTLHWHSHYHSLIFEKNDIAVIFIFNPTFVQCHECTGKK